MRIDGSSSYLYIKDVAGNVLGLQNSSGTLVNTYTYSPFGETTASEGVAHACLFKPARITQHCCLDNVRIDCPIEYV